MKSNTLNAYLKIGSILFFALSLLGLYFVITENKTSFAEDKEIWEGCTTCSDGSRAPESGVCPNDGGGDGGGDDGGGDGGGGGPCTDAEVPDMQDIGISEESRQKLISQCWLYKLAAEESCLPWQMFMAIHYREGTGNGSLSNGYPDLCNFSDTGCQDICCYNPSTGGSDCPTPENDAKCAGKILKDKINMVMSGGVASGDPCNPDDNLVKWAFYCYNGCSFDGDPNTRTYVMSYYPGWDGSSDANPGTYTIYAKLMGRF